MTSDAPGPIRIGHAERTAAISALDEHLAAGRLDADEYGDRVARAGEARDQAELTALFTDLPPVRGSSLPGYVAGPVPSAPVPSATNPDGSAAPLGGRIGGTLVAAAPIIAVILFFTIVHTWVIFLLVPLAGALVYGAGGRRNYGRRRNRR